MVRNEDSPALRPVQLPKNAVAWSCPICGNSGQDLNFISWILPVQSGALRTNDYRIGYCPRCAVGFPNPMPDPARLEAHYQGNYRASSFDLDLDGKRLAPPIEIPWSAYSLGRFRKFYEIVRGVERQSGKSVIRTGEKLIDIGGYQGLFAHAATTLLSCDAIVADLNPSGLQFARGALGLNAVHLPMDVYGALPLPRARLITMIHALEHFEHPLALLKNLRANALEDGGYFYVEVPNILGFPMSDPTHCLNFSREGLIRLFELAGFEVVATEVDGYPTINEWRFHGPQMNLHLLARATGKPVDRPVNLSASVMRSRMRCAALSNGSRYIWRCLRHSTRSLAQAVTTISFMLVFDLLLPTLGLSRLGDRILIRLQRIRQRG